MAAKLPDFKPLPQNDESAGPQSQAQPVEYTKKVERTSYINPAIDQQAGKQLGYDPKMRRQWSVEPTLVHATRHPEPTGFTISDDLRQRHADSVKQYPGLNLSNAEYVVAEVYRHPIGLFLPVAGSVLVIIILLSVLVLYPFIASSNEYSSMTLPSYLTIISFILPVMVIVLIFTYIAVWVYQRNKFYLTNESVIQEIQHSLFSKHEQTVSLGSVEDVSYFQNGLIPTMFNYGHIRMSTEGEESTYRFYYVANPRRQVAILTNAVEDFKNGRPVIAAEPDSV